MMKNLMTRTIIKYINLRKKAVAVMMTKRAHETKKFRALREYPYLMKIHGDGEDFFHERLATYLV